MFMSGGECDSLNQVDVTQCVNCIKKYRDNIIGVKVRLSESLCGDGKYEKEVYARALKASSEAKVPLMTHHALSSIPTGSDDKGCLSCPGSLQCGDIYTHMYHSYVVVNNRVNKDFLKARRKGVLFDVGHGMGGFSWENAEICIKEKFWPDIISTDLHTESCFDGPAYDLTTVMSKFLYLGMPLSAIIKAVTMTPANIMKMSDIASLTKGTVADITLLKIVDEKIFMEDCHQQVRDMDKVIKAVLTWRAGIKYNCLY